MPHHRELSKQGAEFIAGFEGFRAEPTTTPTTRQTPPSATGTLIHKGPVTAADEARYRGGLSKEAALKLLKDDAAACGAAVNRAVEIELSQAQFDALVSFTYNVGAGALQSFTLLREINSGTLVKNLHSGNDGDRHTAQDATRSAFLMWDKGSGVILPGLAKRRAAEAHLFMTGESFR